MKNIDVKGTIVANEDKWIYEWLGYEATSPKDISEQLASAGGEDVTFIINSGGGDVFAGNEINYLISQYKGNTIADIAGIAASIATVICCAADKCRMSASSQYMIHNVSGSAYGDYRDMDHASDVLQTANKSISNAYRNKTGMSEKDLLKLMNDETWMDADKAKELGFVDEIIGESKSKSLYNSSCYAKIVSDELKEKIRNQVKNPQVNEDDQADFLIQKNKLTILKLRGEIL